MKLFESEAIHGSYDGSEAMYSSLLKITELIKEHPAVLDAVRGANEKMRGLFAEAGFQLYPTVKKTTLFYGPEANCFFKVIHPLNLKNRMLHSFTNKAKSVFTTSEYLISRGIKLQKVTAYGTIKKAGLPFFAVRKAEGESLHEKVIKRKQDVSLDIYMNILDETAKLHKLGYWFSDANLSHFFTDDAGITGIIDIDSIRKNRPFMVKNLAKDLAGFNHPGLPLSSDKKKELYDHYRKAMSAGSDRVQLDERKLLQLVRHYTARRWKK